MEEVTHLFVPNVFIYDTEEALRSAGSQGYELFVLWSGVVDGDRFRVQNLHVPRQTSYRTEDGLCVMVVGDELHRLNVWLFEEGQVLGVQVHAHPGDAFHSYTDDTYPIVTARGSTSVVVPRFARDGLLIADTAVFRLRVSGWVKDSRPVQDIVVST